MSSHEPELGDEDTGPVDVARTRTRTTSGWDDRLGGPVSVNPRAVNRDRRPTILIAAAAAAVVGLAALAWTFWPSSEDAEKAEGSTATGVPTEAQQEAQTRLLDMLPPGYASDACEPVVPAKGALAQVSCSRNDDTGGPLSAIYTLAEDQETLTDLFDGVVDTSAVVNCPGNIQSPGPWRRNATPDRIAGILVCGFQQSRPTVAWTTDADLMMSEVQSGPQGPNLVQLYTWWSSHS